MKEHNEDDNGIILEYVDDENGQGYVYFSISWLSCLGIILWIAFIIFLIVTIIGVGI